MFFPIDLRCEFVYHPTGHGWQELIQFHEAFYVIQTKQLEAVKCEEMGAVQRTEATNENYKQTMLKMGIKIIAISHQLYLCCGWVLTKGWIGSEFWEFQVVPHHSILWNCGRCRGLNLARMVHQSVPLCVSIPLGMRVRETFSQRWRRRTLHGKFLYDLNGFQFQLMYGEFANPFGMIKQDKEIERLQQEIIRLRTK